MDRLVALVVVRQTEVALALLLEELVTLVLIHQLKVLLVVTVF
jgi:hypothetical protein